MRVLCACEESQEVCKAFRKRGHEAYSCDIIPCSGGHPEWHILQDVVPLLDGFCQFRTMDGKPHDIPETWDLIIAFPPCTHLCASGARWFAEGKKPEILRTEAAEFFMEMVRANAKKIAVETRLE